MKAITRRNLPPLLCALLIAFAVLRVAATLRVFSETADEPTHVAAGMELYQFHRYQVQRANPPVARVVLALAPELAGMRVQPAGENYLDQLHSVFYGPGAVPYARRLFLARIGNALFLVLAALVLFFFVRMESDDLTALVAVFLVTFEPVVLGHSGLATTDAAAMAGLALALFAFARWLRAPTAARAALFAAAWAFAILCKFSNIPFVPLACLVVFVVRRGVPARRAATLLVVLIVTPLVIWGGYAFTVGTLADLDYVRDAFGPVVARFIAEHPRMRVPAPDFFFGVGHLQKIAREGQLVYFRGAAGNEGWALYFPASVLLKTTLVSLLLIAVGAWFARGTLRRLMIESFAAALLLLAFSSTSRLDLGVRYVLPLFVPLSVAAAAGAAAMIRSRHAAMIAACALLAWHAGASIAAHPDYFPYFNFLAGRDPSRIFIDSNLDWGQDVLRLRDALRRAHAGRVGVSLLGLHDLDALGFPPHYTADGALPTAGWIAVGDHPYRLGMATTGGWRWLDNMKFQMVGKSIRLYFVRGTIEPAAILLPFAGTPGDVEFPAGVRWNIRQQVANRGPGVVHVESNTGPFNLAPGQSVPIAAPYGQPPYVVLRVDPSTKDQLSASTLVRRTDAAGHGFSMSVPQVRDADFARRTIVIPRVPYSSAARLNLRVWSVQRAPARFDVRILSGGKVLAQRTFASDDTGYFSSGWLQRDFPELAGREFTPDVTITIDAGDARLWACITATDNATNLPRLLLP